MSLISSHLASAANPVATFSIKNRSSYNRLQWAHVSIPFKKGMVPDETDLNRFSLDHGSIDWSPIKWHFQNGKKHSISIAALKFPVYLTAGEEKTFEVYEDQKPNAFSFDYGPNFKDFLLGVEPILMIFAVAKFKDDPTLYLSESFQNGAVLHNGVQQKSYRWRSQFVSFDKSKTAHSLSSTIYFDLMNRQDFGNIVVSIGNNTFEKPYSGGVQVEYVDLYYKSPFRVQIRNASDYGVGSEESIGTNFKKIRLLANEILADGSAHSFRGIWSIIQDSSSLTAQSAQAELADPLFGIASTNNWDQSKSAGIVGNLLAPRGTPQQLKNSLEYLCGTGFDVKKSSFFRYANKVPSQTGDQPAFSSNMPAHQQQAIVGQSSCPIQHAMHGVIVEEYRPSYFWFNNRRMSWNDTPKTCFWWSGRPHFVAGHNVGHCSQWLAHTEGYNGFKMGPSPVGGEDDQHWGNPILQAVYEMSGDMWAKDLLHARQSLALWNKLGDYGWQKNRVGSERAVRLPYNATQLVLLNPDTPEAEALLPRIARHMKLRITGGCFAGGRYCSDGIDQWKSGWGVHGLESIFGDNRHSLFIGTTSGAKCANGKGCENNRGMISWWTGFSMTFVYQMLKTGIETTASQDFLNKYMNEKSFYFDSTGQNAGGRRLNNWSMKENSFTQAWHSGWISAVENFGTKHSNYTWFKDVMIPHTREGIQLIPQPGRYWKSEDKWFH